MTGLARNKSRQPMTPIVHGLPCGGEGIRIRAISDVHIGDAHCMLDKFRAMVQEIEADPDCYTMLVGDICNTAIAGSKSDVYSETMKPGEQVKTAVEILRPIADRILAVVPGNHEERIYRTTGIQTTEDMAYLLGISDRYRDTSALIYVSVGDGKGAAHGRPPMYSIYANHGHGGGGRRAGSKVNSLQDLGYVIDCDLIIAGHTHVPATFRQARLACCPQTRTVEMREQTFVNLASMLEYGGYGNRNGYQPPSNRYPVVELSSKKHEIGVTM